MKKNKPPERAPADFKNNPFKSLKGLKPPAAPAPAGKAAKPAQKETAEDAENLFLRAVDDVKEIAPRSVDMPETAKRKVAAKSIVPEQNEEQLFLRAMQKIGATFREEPLPEADEAPRQSASSRMKQLKRGTIRISDELDLHGYLKDEALVRLQHFIAAASTRGQKAVLVITGKGINSPEGPVLQGAVADWLRGKGKGLVAEFSPAPRDKGGSGAFVVFLKTKQ